MAQLYADEDFPFAVVKDLRLRGHDVLTAQEAGRARKKIPDPQQLAYAINAGRAVLTINRKDCVKLHKRGLTHKGIIVCSFDPDFMAQAQRIHDAIVAAGVLDNKLLRINKPSGP